MHLTTDYVRQLWTGLSTDDWGDVEFFAGDVVYIMDQSQCRIFDGSAMHQLPDLGGGGGPNLSQIQDVFFKNVYGSSLSFNVVRYLADQYFYGSVVSFSSSGSGAEKHAYELLVVDGIIQVTASYTNYSFSYQGNIISELVDVPLYPSGAVHLYELTLPANYDNTIPIEVTRI